MKRTILLTGLVIFLNGCGGGGGTYTYANNGNNQETIKSAPSDAPEINNTTKNNYLDAINKARSKARYCGDEYYEAAKPLKWSDALYKAAYEHTNDMASQNFLEHEGSFKKTDITGIDLGHKSEFYERIRHNGYNYLSTGENIAGGQKNLQEVMQAWLNSPHHCANIMNPEFSDVGMAHIKKDGTKYIHYWTQDFGSKD